MGLFCSFPKSSMFTNVYRPNADDRRYDAMLLEVFFGAYALRVKELVSEILPARACSTSGKEPGFECVVIFA